MSSTRYAPRHHLTGLFRHRRQPAGQPAMIPAPVAVDVPAATPAPGTIWGRQDGGPGPISEAAAMLRGGLPARDVLADIAEAAAAWPPPHLTAVRDEPRRRDTASETTITWDRPADLMVSRPQARLTRPFTDPAARDIPVSIVLERSKLPAVATDADDCRERMMRLAYPAWGTATRAQWEAWERQVSSITGTRATANEVYLQLAPPAAVLEPTTVWTPQRAPVRGRAIEAGTRAAA